MGNSVDLIIFSTEFTVQRILPQNDKTEKTFGFQCVREFYKRILDIIRIRCKKVNSPF